MLLIFSFLRMDRNGCTAPLAVLLACSGQFSSEYHPLFRYPENCDAQNQFNQSSSRLPSCNNEFPPPLQRTLRKVSKQLVPKVLSIGLKSLSKAPLVNNLSMEIRLWFWARKNSVQLSNS